MTLKSLYHSSLPFSTLSKLEVRQVTRGSPRKLISRDGIVNRIFSLPLETVSVLRIFQARVNGAPACSSLCAVPRRARTLGQIGRNGESGLFPGPDGESRDTRHSSNAAKTTGRGKKKKEVFVSHEKAHLSSDGSCSMTRTKHEPPRRQS